MILRVPALDRVLGALADYRRRRHVTAGFTKHAVVEQHARNRLASGCRMNDFLQPFVDHVTVALKRENQLIWAHALCPGCKRWCATMECLNEVDVHNAGERGIAPDPHHSDRALGHGEFFDRFEHHAQCERFAATRAKIMVFAQEECWLDISNALGGNARRMFRVEDEFASFTHEWFPSVPRPR